jgi:RNA polymerase sigma-70 factor (ECF subfamily)
MTTGEYNQCVDNFSDGVYRFLLKNTKDTHLASDLVQESFMKLWIKRKEVEFAKGKSYLFTTAYHTMIDYFRKNKRMVTVENHNHNSQTLENEYSDLKEVIDKAVEKLPDVQRSVLLLRDYEGYSYDEIGEMTGLSETQVKVYIYRARLFMKNYIISPEYVV